MYTDNPPANNWIPSTIILFFIACTDPNASAGRQAKMFVSAESNCNNVTANA